MHAERGMSFARDGKESLRLVVRLSDEAGRSACGRPRLAACPAQTKRPQDVAFLGRILFSSVDGIGKHRRETSGEIREALGVGW